MLSQRTVDVWRFANGQDYRLYNITIKRADTIVTMLVEISDEVFHQTTGEELEEALQIHYNFKDIKLISVIPITQIWSVT